MIPRELIPSVVITTSELQVHSALADLDVPGVGLRSPELPDHGYELSAEAVSLVVIGNHLLVVEVKGARVACADGIWTHSDRHGNYRTSHEGPFRQADRTMYELRRLVAERPGVRQTSGLAYGVLVVTPDVDLPSSVEWADETHIGQGCFSRCNGLRDGLRRASRYWRAKQPRGGRLSGAPWSAAWPGTSMSWTSAANAKGLENRFVCVIDVDEPATDGALDKLYVALSRARAGPVDDGEDTDRLREQYLLYSPAALEVLGRGNT